MPAPFPEGILVTGGSGFIGSNLIRVILGRLPSARVVSADDLSSGSERRLEGLPVERVRLDVGTDDLSGRWPDRAFDAVFHLAAITDTTVTDAARMRRVNVEGSRNVFRWALRHGVPVVYASSAAVYGITDRPCREDGPRHPANIYGVSKMEAEDAAAEFAARGLQVAGVRYFNVYGPGEDHKGRFASMIWQLSLQMRAGKRPRIFKHGEQKRDFVHVDDAVDATLRALSGKPGAVYNVGSGTARSFNDVIAELNRRLGTDLAPDYFDCPYDFFQPFTQADVGLARKELGYAPRYSLEEGVRAYFGAGA